MTTTTAKPQSVEEVKKARAAKKQAKKDAPKNAPKTGDGWRPYFGSDEPEVGTDIRISQPAREVESRPFPVRLLTDPSTVDLPPTIVTDYGEGTVPNPYGYVLQSRTEFIQPLGGKEGVSVTWV